MNKKLAVALRLAAVLLGLGGCATPTVHLYPGETRLPGQVATIVVVEPGYKLKTVLSSKGQTFTAASLLPEQVDLRVDLKKQIPDFAVSNQTSTPDESSQGLGSGGGVYNLKTRSLKRYISFKAKAGVTYQVHSRWVTVADRKDPLWYEGMRGERIRVWVTDAADGSLVASEPACEVALPVIREQPRCWFYPER